MINETSILLLKGADARYNATMEDNILTSAQCTWHNSYISLLRCIVAIIILGSAIFISYSVISRQIMLDSWINAGHLIMHTPIHRLIVSIFTLVKASSVCKLYVSDKEISPDTYLFPIL